MSVIRAALDLNFDFVSMDSDSPGAPAARRSVTLQNPQILWLQLQQQPILAVRERCIHYSILVYSLPLSIYICDIHKIRRFRYRFGLWKSLALHMVVAKPRLWIYLHHFQIQHHSHTGTRRTHTRTTHTHGYGYAMEFYFIRIGIGIGIADEQSRKRENFASCFSVSVSVLQAMI